LAIQRQKHFEDISAPISTELPKTDPRDAAGDASFDRLVAEVDQSQLQLERRLGNGAVIKSTGKTDFDWWSATLPHDPTTVAYCHKTGQWL
jgi:hypothetical protein